ncbi:MAG TPA: 3-oxoacyl-ACP reductase FabG [Candidatus Acidoferrales bacterium]|nr:3-oxoacyl-ACP reductase FabG [Candidatus Acidoferrales bacterium]
MKRFDDQVALITGGAQGIGEATVRRFAEEGAKVVIADLNGEAAEAVAASVRAQGGEALGVACDVQEEAGVEALVESGLSSFGQLDILVSNAGVTRDNLLHKMSLAEWDQVIQVHTRGAFLCARAVARNMVSRKRGKMVFLSSTSALGNRGQANYSTAKAGLQGLTRTLALELGQFQINVNSVAPGFVDTAMTRAVAERLHLSLEDFWKEAADRIPLGRLGQPEDIAGVIAFLCSKDAAYVSGQVIYVNGGRTS